MALQLTFFRCASCPSCDQQAAILDHVKREAPGDVEFREVPMSGDKTELARYRVTTHPVLVLERGGVELKRWSTVVGKLELLGALRELLGPIPPALTPVEVPSGPVSGQLPGKSEVQSPPAHPGGPASEPPDMPGPGPP